MLLELGKVHPGSILEITITMAAAAWMKNTRYMHSTIFSMETRWRRISLQHKLRMPSSKQTIIFFKILQRLYYIIQIFPLIILMILILDLKMRPMVIFPFLVHLLLLVKELVIGIPTFRLMHLYTTC